MSKCDHTAWLEVETGETGPFLSYGSRFAQVTQQLHDPSAQFPGLVFFMGRRRKNVALRQLYRGSLGRHSTGQNINLRLNNDTARCKNPTIFADCDPNQRPSFPTLNAPKLCHPTKSYPISWSENGQDIFDVIFARLLFLFTDVLCIFAEDVGGLRGVNSLLKTWASIGSASSLPKSVRPSVIVVTQDENASVTGDVLDEEEFLVQLFETSNSDLLATFSSVNFLRLGSNELSPMARHLPLADAVLSELETSRLSRVGNLCLFSATHLNAFFEDALRHASVDLPLSFDFVSSSRRGNSLDRSFASHLQTFLSLGVKMRTPYDSLASFIASAILMDSYPPGMHGMYIGEEKRSKLI